jgi:hypothetical protein
MQDMVWVLSWLHYRLVSILSESVSPAIAGVTAAATLLIILSITTTVFTLIGLSLTRVFANGYERNSETTAGMSIVTPTVLFAFECVNRIF